MEARGCVLCVLLLSFALGDAKYFKFEDCSKKNDAIAEVSAFKISPDPIDMKKNVTVSLTAKLLRDVPPEAVLKTRYYKIKNIFGVKFNVPIPCILGKFGSCTFKLCDFMDIFKDQGEVFFLPEKEYGCPVRADEFVREDVGIPKPYVPPLARMVVGGKYGTEMRLFEKDGGKELACYKMWTEIR